MNVDKNLKIAVLVMVFILAYSCLPASAQEVAAKPSFVIGLPFLAVGRAYYNEMGHIKSIFAINWLLGISYRRYAGEGLCPGCFTPFVGAGMIIILIPYREIGLTLTIPLGGGAQLVNI